MTAQSVSHGCQSPDYVYRKTSCVILCVCDELMRTSQLHSARRSIVLRFSSPGIQMLNPVHELTWTLSRSFPHVICQNDKSLPQQGKTNMTSCENQECLSHSCRIQEFFLQLIQTRQSYVLFKFHIYRITMQDGGGGGGGDSNTITPQTVSNNPLTLKLWILKAGTKKTSWGHNLWKFFEVSSQTISRRL